MTNELAAINKIDLLTCLLKHGGSIITPNCVPIANILLKSL